MNQLTVDEVDSTKAFIMLSKYHTTLARSIRRRVYSSRKIPVDWSSLDTVVLI
jgi:hypothetical protein